MEEDDRSSPRVSPIQHPTAGIIKKIRLVNFLCHSHQEIEFGNYVNFITGQNGSGKSAILAALCIAFGCRAKGTQRASTLKKLIKNGASNAVIHVEIQNEGEDAFKPEKFGDLIIVERKIYESSSTITLKNHRGKIVSHGRADLREIVEHFNIDVENPCVIMNQFQSQDFLRSGNSKDQFTFFFKVTLLQQVSDLLESIYNEIKFADGIVEELEAAIRPIEKELKEIEVKIKATEHVEQISMQVQQLKKKLAWSWVYDVDRKLKVQSEKIEKLKSRIPFCQAKIDEQLHLIIWLTENWSKKKDEIACMLGKTSEAKQMKENLSWSLSLARKEELELELVCKSKTINIQKMEKQLRMLKQLMQDIQDQHVKNTQVIFVPLYG
ncbi:hypothetical protein RIF29_29345 [Crotalaria pallida]|uniref:Rad50/SbcC-type AAA domain-containing protein n=1 Tax=Crotalaria pallida TaxID=3830 RepID=A0AAN9EED3_CROPI